MHLYMYSGKSIGKPVLPLGLAYYQLNVTSGEVEVRKKYKVTLFLMLYSAEFTVSSIEQNISSVISCLV